MKQSTFQRRLIEKLFEDDYVYTTDQQKTDDHVKQFVRQYISNPKVDLKANGLVVSGKAKSTLRDSVSVDGFDDGIAITTKLSNKIIGIVSDLIDNMIDQSPSKVATDRTKSKSIPIRNQLNKSCQFDITFVSDDYNGKIVVTLQTVVDKDQTDVTGDIDVTIDGEWYEK